MNKQEFLSTLRRHGIDTRVGTTYPTRDLRTPLPFMFAPDGAFGTISFRDGKWSSTIHSCPAYKSAHPDATEMPAEYVTEWDSLLEAIRADMAKADEITTRG